MENESKKMASKIVRSKEIIASGKFRLLVYAYRSDRGRTRFLRFIEQETGHVSIIE